MSQQNKEFQDFAWYGTRGPFHKAGLVKTLGLLTLK